MTSNEQSDPIEVKQYSFRNLERFISDNSWRNVLSKELRKPYFAELEEFLTREARTKIIYPPKTEIFNAFNHCSFHKVKVVILGQEPYPTPSQSNGLAFSVNAGNMIPKALSNIYKQVYTEIPGFEKPEHGNLIEWTKQGVFLLNMILTVEHQRSNSHMKQGWEKFTDEVIKLISSERDHVVFMLWGLAVIRKEQLIDTSKHLVLKAAHPSPLSAKAFFGCNHFSQANNYLLQNGISPVNWQFNCPFTLDRTYMFSDVDISLN